MEQVAATVINLANLAQCLPPKILLRVVAGFQGERDLIAATHVCAQWRAILTSTPYLWTKINFEHSTRANIYLERSKTALINITIGKSKGINGPAEILSGAPPSWIARTRSLCIQTDNENIKKVAGRLFQEMPNLQSLTIEGKQNQPYNPYYLPNGPDVGGAIYIPAGFLGRHAPLLQRLTFHLVCPSVVLNFPLPNLTHIDWVSKTALVAIEGLLELFGSSPLLEDIRMHAWVQRTILVDLPLKVVTLNKLHKLDWADCNGSLNLIKSCLITPVLSNLALEVTHHPQDQWATLPFVSNNNHVCFYLKPTTVEYICQRIISKYTTLPSISRVKEGYVSNHTINHWFPPSLPISFSRTQRLTITTNCYQSPLSDFPIWMFKNLHGLFLIGEIDSLVQIIKVNHKKFVPCPSLLEIGISPIGSNTFTPGKLRNILKERKEAGHGVKTIQITQEGWYECKKADIKELEEVVNKIIRVTRF